MPRLKVDRGTLKTRVIAEKGERKTLVSRWVGTITNTVSQGNVRLQRQAGPTVSARFYSMAGTGMYEAWQLFDRRSKSSIGSESKRLLRRAGSLNPSRAVIENVISRTALKVLSSNVSGITRDGRREILRFYRQSKNTLSDQTQRKVRKIAREVADSVVATYSQDGFDRLINYKPVNPDPHRVRKIDRWTPEFQISDHPASGLQTFLTPQWGDVSPFGLGTRELRRITGKAAAPEPFLLDPRDTHNLRKGVIFDNGKGKGKPVPINAHAVGRFINPRFIRQTENVLAFSRKLNPGKAGTRRKGIAEYWEDGPDTPFPPGTWMVFGQYASLAENNSLGEDAQLFLGLAASLHNAGISSWDLKLNTDYVRPIRAVQDLSRFGLLKDADGNPSNGSQFHAYNRRTGKVDLITGSDWETYQKQEGGYSPPFAEYTSGHSTFSAAGAEFLKRFTGSKAFGGKVAFDLSFEFPNGGSTELQWKTWQEAALDAGRSRLWGGIHFPDGNRQGLKVGDKIGSAVHHNLSQLWG